MALHSSRIVMDNVFNIDVVLYCWIADLVSRLQLEVLNNRHQDRLFKSLLSLCVLYPGALFDRLLGRRA